jgi:hypothetical protein
MVIFELNTPVAVKVGKQAVPFFIKRKPKRRSIRLERRTVGSVSIDFTQHESREQALFRDSV